MATLPWGFSYGLTTGVRLMHIQLTTIPSGLVGFKILPGSNRTTSAFSSLLGAGGSLQVDGAM